jgi:NitT/TauT family transport system ATP-binding protein
MTSPNWTLRPRSRRPAPEDGPPAAAQTFRATGISFSYATGAGTFAVFRDVSLAVPRGKTLALFGPNGTGKSTLMRCLAGARVDSGRIEAPLIGSSRPRIGYIPQNYVHARSSPGRPSRPTSSSTCPIPSRGGGRTRPPSAMPTTPCAWTSICIAGPGQCSGGMLQQAALIRALARRPDLLIADEPFSALDFDVASRVRDGFSQAIRDFKICAVATLHDLQDIIEVCDLVLAIPGRPYTTNPTLASHAQARLFENPERKRRSQHGDGPGESPFIRAVSKALGVELP